MKQSEIRSILSHRMKTYHQANGKVFLPQLLTWFAQEAFIERYEGEDIDKIREFMKRFDVGKEFIEKD